MKQNPVKRKAVNKNILNKRKSKILLSSTVLIATIAASSQAAFAMPSYGFGAANNDNGVIHIDMNVGNGNNQAPVHRDMGLSHINNSEAIHINISAMGTASQNIPSNGESIGTLTIPSGKQIGVFGGESMKSMDKGAAHFSDTGLNFSNTALIGHNRGSAGYFIFLKDLQVGQVLTLEANGMTKKYIVAEMHKVHASETELLMHLGDSRLTLVTCWEDARDYRRIVVAYEEQEMI